MVKALLYCSLWFCFLQNLNARDLNLLNNIITNYSNTCQLHISQHVFQQDPIDTLLPGICYSGLKKNKLFVFKSSFELPDSLSDSRYNAAVHRLSPNNRYIFRRSRVSKEVTMFDCKKGASVPLFSNLESLVNRFYKSVYADCPDCADYFIAHRNKYISNGAFGSEMEIEATEFHTFDQGAIIQGKFRYLDSGTATEFELKLLNIILKIDYFGNIVNWIIYKPLVTNPSIHDYSLLFAEHTFHTLSIASFKQQYAIINSFNINYCCGFDSSLNNGIFLTAQVFLDWDNHRIITQKLGPVFATTAMRKRWTSEYFPSVKLVQYRKHKAWIDQVEPTLHIIHKNTRVNIPIKFRFLNADSFNNYSQVKGFVNNSYFSNFSIFDIFINRKYVFVSISEKGKLALLIYNTKRSELISACTLENHILTSVHKNRLVFKDLKSYTKNSKTKFAIFKMR